MKRTNLVKAFAVMAIMAAGAFFVGCANSAGGYTSKYAVGDIVLNDGTKVSYDVAKDYSDEELTEMKSKAIAVIFKADTENKKALGVGLKHDKNGRSWCLECALAYELNVDDIQCRPSNDAEGDYTSAIDTDGSNNLQQIRDELSKKGPSDDTDDSSRYPAFYFAIEYKNAESNITSEYESDWYLPTTAELYDIYRVKTTIEAASELCGGNKFGSDYYWSSSLYSSDSKTNACRISFTDGSWGYHDKSNSNFKVCAIRAFD